MNIEIEAGQTAHQSGFSATGRANQCHNLPTRDTNVFVMSKCFAFTRVCDQYILKNDN